MNELRLHLSVKWDISPEHLRCTQRLYVSVVDLCVGKQAVVVMACENVHMAEDMIMEPGLVMIFAHGVEWLHSTSDSWYSVLNASLLSFLYVVFLKLER